MRPKIFISYAHVDRKRVQPVYLFLKALGLKPWLDKEEMPPGVALTQFIEENIRDSDYFITCLSSSSVDHRGVVQAELKIALNELQKFPEDQIFAIPARLDDCKVPFSFSKHAWVDLFAPGSKIQLLRAFHRHRVFELSEIHEALSQAKLFSPNHNKGRIAFRDRKYAAAEQLAREAYDDIPNPHSKLNEMVAACAQEKIIKRDLDKWVFRLNLQDGGHGKSVLKNGY